MKFRGFQKIIMVCYRKRPKRLEPPERLERLKPLNL
jgi:hypothetical protein